MTQKPQSLGVFALAMISTAAVLTLRNFPTMAMYGWASIAWFVLGGLLFIVPLALAAAELASGWPEDGGVYAWVREAFGERWGFVAVWCAFSQNLIWYPTVLSFIAATLAAAVNPAFAQSKTFQLVVMLSFFWLILGLNLRGTQMTSRLSTFGTIAGTLIPGFLITLLWIAYTRAGKPTAIPFTPSALVPDISPGNLPFLATIVLMFAGIEMMGYYATSTRNPQRDFPKATLLAVVLIVVASIFPTLAIAWVVPAKDIDLNAGIVQALERLCGALGVAWLAPVSDILLLAGAVALITAWAVSPALGLGVVAKAGLLPPFWGRHNANGIPVGVMVLQGVIGSIFTVLYVAIPSVNSAYWIMSAITTEVLIVMYALIFATVIRLRYAQPDRPRPYRIPGGLIGVWLAGGTGLLAIFLAAYVGLFPPAGTTFVSAPVYVGIMLAGTVALSFTPFVFLALRKESWRPADARAPTQSAA
ncbi:MAG TPA: amino acid permease [Gemmatimonadaceae bacterium]|nr:amino acid permease [Gemmatimonadaceae bacterium]